MIQTHVFYSGTVQGVGFRYAVRRYATDAGLSGWVRNLPDGRVEVLVEGAESAVAGLLREIETRFEGYISGKNVSTGAPEGAYKDFMIIS